MNKNVKILLNPKTDIITFATSLNTEELENLKGDSSKLRKELSWQPEYTFETMLDEMIEYWVEYYGK